MPNGYQIMQMMLLEAISEEDLLHTDVDHDENIILVNEIA